MPVGAQGADGHLFLVPSMGPNATYDFMVFELDPQNGLVINVFPVPTGDGVMYFPTAVSFGIDKRFLYISGQTYNSSAVH